jgi:hypothetical protein
MRITVLTLLFSLSSFAGVAPCDGLPASSVDQIDLSITIPNCLQPRALAQATNQRRNTKGICDCKAEFEQKAMLPSSTPISVSKKQEMFFATMLQEYEKVQKNTLVEIAKLSALDPQGKLSFQNSLNACQFKTEESFRSGCGSRAASQLFANSPLFKSYGQRLTNEFLNIMSPIQSPLRVGLLNRSSLFSNFSAKACSLNESEALKFSSLAMESIIAPGFIEAINQKKTELTGKSIDEIFEMVGYDATLKDQLRQHPLIGLHMSTPQQLINLFTSVSSPFSKVSLNQTLMNSENTRLVDQKLAASCGNSFNSLKSAVCSDKFENGVLELDPFGNLERLGIVIPGTLPPIASSDELINLNRSVLQFCPWTNNQSAQSLSQSIQPLDELLEPNYRGISSDQFDQRKFSNDISSVRDQICSQKDVNQSCDRLTSLVERQSCLAAQLWRESQSQPSLTPELLAQRPISQLIRGFLPAAESLNPETKQALARIGIIPTPQAQRPSPAQVAQAAAEVERFNPNFTSAANATLPRTRTQSPVVTTVADVPVESRVQAAGGQRPAYSAQLAEVMSQKQRMFEESNETYRSVIDELMKRRMDNPSQQEVTEAVTEEFRQAGKPFDPRSREGQSFINNIVNNYPRAVAQNNPQVITRPFEQERVAQAFEEAVTTANSSPGPTAGRSIAGTDINSIAASASLTSSPAANGVAKVVVTDPKLNLADPALPQLLQSVLTLNENGEVLQSMLDQRKDFILKLNSTEVMMDFDPEAQTYRIRPLGTVPEEVIASLNRFVNDYSLIARVRGSRHTTLNALVQELQQSQSSL